MTKNIITITFCLLFIAVFIGCNKAPEEGMQTKAETEISEESGESTVAVQTDDSSSQSEDAMSAEEMTADCEHCEKDCLSSDSKKTEDVSKTENLEE